jgi:CheY-like chemotaxis protein
VFNNLLSNAVKFTDKGGVTIEAAAQEHGGRLVLRVCVADTGLGVSGEGLARIFQPFEQGDPSIARTHGGTGLGLALSRELARLMGGDLTAESKLGDGSRFTMLANLGRAVPGREPLAPPPPPVQADLEARILVVDDHEIGRRALGLLLGPLGAEITSAGSGREALEILAQERFDLVLMDVSMAGMDGCEACRALRSRPGPNQQTPVIAVTGHTEPEQVDACRAAGMTGWVAKPVEPHELYEAIESALMARDMAVVAA